MSYTEFSLTLSMSYALCDHSTTYTSNALLGGGVGVRVREDQKKIKGTTKPLLAILDLTAK